MKSGEWFELLSDFARKYQEALSEEVREEAKLAPGTWLLRTGWLKHGLIGVQEGPAERPLHRSTRRVARGAK